MNRLIAFILSVCLISTSALSSVHVDENLATDNEVDYADEFLNQTEIEAVYNPSYGNDRIIFAAARDKEYALYEGLSAGGSILRAEEQCLKSKPSYEAVYGRGICERVRWYAPKRASFEQFVNEFVGKIASTFIWGIVVPAGLVATVAVSCTVGAGVCACKKLKTA